LKFSKNYPGVSGSKIDGSDKWKVTFKLEPNEKKKRICDILNAIKNGVCAQSSGEANTLSPFFMIASGVKVPSPIFHTYIEIAQIDSKTYKVIGLEDGVKNGWIDGKIYIMDSQKLKVEGKNLFQNIPEDWKEFLGQIGCENLNQQQSAQS
ncbi:MAG: hypothetical protein ACPLZ9_03640, partial [Candidatus Ratteibacteria bacterium]